MKELFQVIIAAIKIWLKKIQRQQKVLDNLDEHKIDVTNEQVASAENLNELIDNISGRTKHEKSDSDL
jgi:hypothetical protein